jgi:hypothetical protein
MLRYTSCLFSTIVLHSYHHHQSGSFRITCYHHLFLLVTVLSILYHCTQCTRIGIADFLCAHAAFTFVVMSDSLPAIDSGAAWVLLFPLLVSLLWLGEKLWPERANAMHASLHLVSVVGVHCYLAVL